MTLRFLPILLNIDERMMDNPMWWTAKMRNDKNVFAILNFFPSSFNLSSQRKLAIFNCLVPHTQSTRAFQQSQQLGASVSCPVYQSTHMAATTSAIQ